MSSAAEILVVFLSVALAIFITLGIITFVLVIRVTRQIGDVAEKMQNITASIDGIAQNVAQVTSPIIIGKTIFDIFNKFKNKTKMNFFDLVKTYSQKNEIVLMFIGVLAMIKDQELQCVDKDGEIILEYKSKED